MYILRNPSHGAPWFIINLFSIQFVYFLCCALCHKYKEKGNLILPIVLLCSVPVVLGLLQWKKVLWGVITPGYLTMFILGHITQTFELKRQLVRPLIIVCFLAFLIIAPYYDVNMDNAKIREGIKLIASVFFSIFAYLIVKHVFSEIDVRVRRFVNYLGSHTLEIYLTTLMLGIHQIYLDPWIDTDTMNSITLFLIVLVLTIPTCFVVVKLSDALMTIPLMRLLLYGKRR